MESGVRESWKVSSVGTVWEAMRWESSCTPGVRVDTKTFSGLSTGVSQPPRICQGNETRVNCREKKEKQEQGGVPEAERKVFQDGERVSGSYAADWSSPTRSENGLPCRHCRSHWSLSQVQFQGEGGSRA